MTDTENPKEPPGGTPNDLITTSQGDQGVKSPTKTLSPKLKKVLGKLLTLLKNLFCLTIWIWLISRKLGEPPLLAEVFRNISSLIIPYAFAIKVGALILVVGLIFFKKVSITMKFIFFLLLRFIFFPFILLYYIFYLPFKAIKLTFQGVNIFLYKLIRTSILKAAILLVIILPANLLIILLAHSGYFLIFSLAFSILGLIITLRVAFRWTAKPLIILEEFLSTYFKIVDFFLTRIARQAKEKPENPQKIFESLKKHFESLHNGLDWLEGFVERSTDRKIIVKYFFILFAACFALTVLSFAIVYLTLNKLNTPAFLGSQNWTLFDFLYTSLLVITTSGEIAPIWIWAKIAVAAEIIFGICLLSLLIFHFSLVSIPEVLERKKNVLSNIRDKKTDVINQEEIVKMKLFGKPVEGVEIEEKKD